MNSPPKMVRMNPILKKMFICGESRVTTATNKLIKKTGIPHTAVHKDLELKSEPWMDCDQPNAVQGAFKFLRPEDQTFGDTASTETLTIKNAPQDMTNRITENEKPAEWREPPTFTSAGDSGNDTGHLAELVAFVQALAGQTDAVRSSIYDSYKSMVLYEAIEQSAATGAVVAASYESLD